MQVPEMAEAEEVAAVAVGAVDAAHRQLQRERVPVPRRLDPEPLTAAPVEVLAPMDVVVQAQVREAAPAVDAVVALLSPRIRETLHATDKATTSCRERVFRLP